MTPDVLQYEGGLWLAPFSLAFYYADRFDDGRRQFEIHHTVNPADVENVAWHFACVARDKGVDTARRAIISVGADARVPMREILELFAGRAEPAAVLAAAEAGPEDARRNHRCFAHLYRMQRVIEASMFR
jgi:hypothetical protein